MTRTLYNAAFLLALPLCFSGCESLDTLGMLNSQSPSVNRRFEKSEQCGIDKPLHEFTAQSDAYKIYAITDIHATDKTDNLEAFVSLRLEDDEAEGITLCLGDLVNGRGYFPHVHEVLSPLDTNGKTLLCTPGNHDLYFGEWYNYAQFWPASTYYFTIKTPSQGSDLFICLDSAEGTLGTSQRQWLQQLPDRVNGGYYRHVIVFTHTHFFKLDSSQGTTGNYTLEETADLLSLFSSLGVDYVFTGHDHWFEKTQFRGVTYYTLSSFTELETRHCWYVLQFSDDLSVKAYSLTE